jgi:hypothetical protein
MPRTFSRACAALAAALPLLASCQQDQPVGTGPYAKEVAKAVPLIEKTMGLKFKRPPKVEARSKDEVRAFLQKKFDEDEPALEMAGAERAYKLLGLLPDTLDLRKFMVALLTEQVIGYYDPAAKVLYVVANGGPSKDAPSAEILNITITHELVHALQDQYISLDSIAKAHGDNDREAAAQAVIEGQAVLEQLSVMLGSANIGMALPGGWDRIRQMIREGQSTMPVFATAPMLIQETLLFPYLSGAEFVKQYKETHNGGVPYQSMPVSTQQVLHPQEGLHSATKQDSAGAPIRIALPKPNNATVIYENDLGEFETRLFLYQHLGDAGVAAHGAAGWAGDEFAAVNTPQGAGVTWLTVWRSALQAAEFRDLMERTIERRYGVAQGSGGRGDSRHFAGKKRQVELVAATVQGRPVVLYTDMPDGASTKVIDLSKVKFERPK